MKAQHKTILASCAILLCAGAGASTGQAAPARSGGSAGDVRAGAATSTGQAAPGIEARVVGSFQMRALVTKALDVAGEHRGQRLRRQWTIAPTECSGNVCATLVVRRQRSAGIEETIALRRTGAGAYAGTASFYAPLRCRGRVYRHGARVPYRVTLAIAGAETVQTIAFARQITATYANSRRIDTTPCPLGRSHDAATYTGVALSPLPTPPAASFTAQAGAAALSAAFTASATLGNEGAPIVSWLWSFGDPASGAADSSTEENPTHVFSAPGSYTVTLAATDANGLTATATQQVQI